MGATNAFHVGGDDAGCLIEADENSEDEWVFAGVCGLGGGIEVALEQGGNVRREDGREEIAKLRSYGSGVRKEGNDCGGDDEDWKESNDRRVGSCLSEIKEVVIQRVKECAVEDRGDAEVSSHGFFP